MSSEDNIGEIQCKVIIEVVNITNGGIEKRTAFKFDNLNSC